MKSNEDIFEERAFIRVKDLISFIKEIYGKVTSFRSDKGFNDYIWILFSGDKGGNSMKFHLEIINDSRSGSRDAVHPFCMFEAPDTHEKSFITTRSK